MNFGRSAPWTVGVEEELFFVDAETLEAAPGFTRVVGEGGARVKPEVFESLVELATPVLPDAAAVLVELTAERARIAERAARHGLRVYAAGSHPCAVGDDQALVPLPRYRQMAESLGDVLRRQLVCGLHVHVSMPDADTCLQAFERVVPWLPVLLSLSANSPFAEGADTGRRSGRAERLLLMPAGGTPPVLHGWNDWDAATAGDASRRHWDVWPRPTYGTLEIRVMDMQTDVRRSAGLAAIVRALAAVPGTAEMPYDRALYARRREEASRLPPDPAGVAELAAVVEPHLQGGEHELAALVLRGRPEAERQLAVAAADGIAVVPRDVAARTLG
jgi:glutamate---cysteine ligase / carboxylate-amine ligase